MVLIIAVFLLALSGLLHGLREYFHKSPIVFEQTLGKESTSFWGSLGWQRKYTNYPINLRPRKWYDHLGVHLNDFWHLCHYIKQAVGVVGVLLMGSVDNAFYDFTGTVLEPFIFSIIILTVWGFVGYWFMSKEVKKATK